MWIGTLNGLGGRRRALKNLGERRSVWTCLWLVVQRLAFIGGFGNIGLATKAGSGGCHVVDLWRIRLENCTLSNDPGDREQTTETQ